MTVEMVSIFGMGVALGVMIMIAVYWWRTND